MNCRLQVVARIFRLNFIISVMNKYCSLTCLRKHECEMDEYCVSLR